MMVLQAISVGRSDVLRRVDARRRSPPGRGRRRASAFQPAASKRFTWSIESASDSRAVDGDAVVVAQHDQLVELQVPGERDRLLADAFHQAAVAGEHIGVVVDQLVAELGGEHALGDRHADGSWRCPGRAGRWWSRRRACGRIPGWPGVMRAELAEALDLVERHRPRSRSDRAAHRAASSRGRPTARSGRGRASAGSAGSNFRKLREQHGGDVGRAHRHAGMAGLGLLDGIHGQGADGVGHTGMIDLRHDENPPEMRCLVAIRRRRTPSVTGRKATGSRGLDSICRVPRKSKADETCRFPKIMLTGDRDEAA